MTELRCEHCGRYIGKVVTLVGEIICANPSCKAGNQFKILTADESKLLKFKFVDAPKPPKAKAAPSDAS